jgi:hypothetical protein
VRKKRIQAIEFQGEKRYRKVLLDVEYFISIMCVTQGICSSKRLICSEVHTDTPFPHTDVVDDRYLSSIRPYAVHEINTMLNYRSITFL